MIRPWWSDLIGYQVYLPSTRFGAEGTESNDVGARRALVVHALLALLPGPLWIFQGDELGLPNGTVQAGGAYDPLGLLADDGGRDAVRTTMPWQAGCGNGFTTGSPWLPSADRAAELTVARQHAEPDSMLHRTRRLFAAGLANLGEVTAPVDADIAGAELIIDFSGSTVPPTELAPLQAAWWRRDLSVGEAA